MYSILADAVERAADIDEAQAKHAAEQAKRMLDSSDKDKASRAHLELELVIAQLRVVRRNSKDSFIAMGESSKKEEGHSCEKV